MDQTYRPLVTILINNRNYGEYLPRSIESSLRQSYGNTGVVVVDDGSTDKSRVVLSTYGREITAVLKEQGGQASAISKGVSVSRGELICLLDSDDVFEEDKVARVVEAFSTDPRIGWVFHGMTKTKMSDGAVIEAYGPERSGYMDLRDSVRAGEIPVTTPATSALCFRRSFLETVVPMPEAPGVEISDAYLKIVALGTAPGYLLTDCLTRQMLHERNRFTSAADEPIRQARIYIRTARELRSRFPELKAISDKLIATALVESAGHPQALPDQHRAMMREYLSSSSAVRQAAIKLRAASHLLRRRDVVSAARTVFS